ncbi:MAG TPA: glycosyltransferase [Candidatus Limnocylindrales bacterium]
MEPRAERPSATEAPDPVVDLATQRAEARAGRDFETADRLRAEIEAAGWKVVDVGTDFRLEPTHPPDHDDGARRRYGASASVPSRLAEAATFPATVLLLATDWPADLARALTGLRDHVTASSQVIVVADDPSDEQTAALDAIEAEPSVENAPVAAPELVWTSARLGTAAAIDIGARMALGSVVVVLDTSVEPTGDVVTPLVDALADPDVAVAGGWGIVSSDLRTFQDAPPGNVDAIEGYCIAFRRDDFASRGPLDERFRYYRNLDIWWSLVLRDEGEDEPPRRAVALADLPAARHEHRGYTSLTPDERDRQSKRNFYRIIDRFGSRRDLLVVNAGR